MKFDRQLLAQHDETANRYFANLSHEAIAWLEARGITPKLQREYVLGLCDDIHPGWLAIPYLRPSGVITFNYRNMAPDAKPKYKSAGKRHLYNTAALDTADHTGEIAICEGEFDAIIATHCNLPAVGIPGATQWTGNKHWHELFRGYPKVWVLADPDEAGENLAEAILDVLPAARIVRLPADVTDTYLEHRSLDEFIRG